MRVFVVGILTALIASVVYFCIINPYKKAAKKAIEKGVNEKTQNVWLIICGLIVVALIVVAIVMGIKNHM